MVVDTTKATPLEFEEQDSDDEVIRIAERESGNKFKQLVNMLSSASECSPKSRKVFGMAVDTQTSPQSTPLPPLETIEDWKELLKADPSAIYRPDVFQIVVDAYDSNLGLWTAIKSACSKCRISTRDLERHIKAECASEEGEQPEIVEAPMGVSQTILSEMVKHNDKPMFAVYDRTSGVITYQDKVESDGKIIRPPQDETYTKGYVLLPTEAEDYGTFEDLYQEIKQFVHRYVDVSEDYESIASIYPIVTWFYDTMYAVVYLRQRGNWGTGKSRFLDVFGSICYRPVKLTGGSSTAPIYRILERWKGTMIMDEGDFKKGTDAEDIVMKILNNGYERNKPISRCNPEDPTEINYFDPFGPKVIATRYDFTDKATESRCFTEIAKETKREDIPTNLTPAFYEEAQTLRNKLLMYRFKNYDRIKELSDDPSFKPDLGKVIKRLIQGAKSFAVIIDNNPDLMEKLRNFLKNLNYELIQEASTTTEGYIVKILEESSPMTKDPKKYPTEPIPKNVMIWPLTYNQLVDGVKVRNKDTSFQSNVTVNSAKNHGKSLGLKTYRGKDGNRYVSCEEELFEQLKRRYIPDYEEDQIRKAEPMDNCPISSYWGQNIWEPPSKEPHPIVAPATPVDIPAVDPEPVHEKKPKPLTKERRDQFLKEEVARAKADIENRKNWEKVPIKIGATA